jgi:hypothetical protein
MNTYIECYLYNQSKIKIHPVGILTSQVGLRIMFAGKEGMSSTTGVDFFLPINIHIYICI